MGQTSSKPSTTSTTKPSIALVTTAAPSIDLTTAPPSTALATPSIAPATTPSTIALASPQADYKTRVNVDKFTFTWEIENFSHCPQENGEELRSGTFSGEDSSIKWKLEIYVRGEDQESKDDISLYLFLVESDRNTVDAKYWFSLKNDKGECSYIKGDQCTHKFKIETGWGMSHFINRSYLLDPTNCLLPDDKLTIVCSMAVAGEIVTVAGQVPMSGSHLRNDPTKPYTHHEFGECVTLSVGGQEFNVYKAILSAKSPVFSAMFEHNTKESQTGQIVIQDTESEVMKELLQFLYTGSAPNLKSMADRLLVLADKYQVEPLKIECEEAMCEQLSVENACAILVQADRLSAARLKSYAIKFMVAKAAAVSRSEGFKSLVEQYPQLHIETFQTMASNQFKPN